MRSRPRLRAALAAVLALALASCGDDSKSKGSGAGKGAGTTSPVVLGRSMPEFMPSGIKEDYTRVRDLKDAVKRQATKEDERAAAKKALADLVAELPGKWEGRDVPAPEGLYYAYILKEAGKDALAVVQARRYMDVAPTDTNNYVAATTILVGCLAASGDYDGASAEVAKALDGAYKGRETERMNAETTIAMSMMKAGQLEKAADHFETLVTLSTGDPESAILGVDCALRMSRVDAAMRIAQKGADFFKEGRHTPRMKQLLDQVHLVGKPAADFSDARAWRGTGGPVTREMMAGKVTVVFSYNMQTQWLRFLIQRVNTMYEEIAPKGVLLVGISRLAHFDPMKMGVIKEMTEEQELEFYERWAQQESIRFTLAIGGYDPDTSLLDAWAAQPFIPTFVVVGKDGKVSYVRTGKEDDHIAILKEMVEKALAQ